jgi:hypothetical protein
LSDVRVLILNTYLERDRNELKVFFTILQITRDIR